MSAVAISMEGVTKTFGGGRTLLLKPRHQVHAVRNVSLNLMQGETLAIVGESGSGKSTLARMLVGLTSPTSGRITIEGLDWRELSAAGPRTFGKTIQYVFQDPVASLNPRRTIAEILDAPLRLLHDYDSSRRTQRMHELLDAVRLASNTLERYPHEFSGGQAQRIAIARALAAEARIVVLDEPVSALDVSVQAQVLLLLDELRREFSLSYVFISHDLAVVEAIADRVAVMYLGDVVELADTRSLFAAPQNAYTRDLINSAPRIAA